MSVHAGPKLGEFGAQEGDLGKHGFRGGKNLHKRLSKTICTNLYTQARLWHPLAPAGCQVSLNLDSVGGQGRAALSTPSVMALHTSEPLQVHLSSEPCFLPCICFGFGSLLFCDH